MMSDTYSNRVLTRKEREELVLDLYFNQNKTFHEIAKIARMSPRDIKPIIDKAINEKERREHKSTAVQAYELFYKGKTLLEVTIGLNLGQAQATAYYGHQKLDVNKFKKDNTIVTVFDTTKHKRLIVDGVHRAAALTMACEDGTTIPKVRVIECSGSQVNTIFPCDVPQLP
jgi:predicted HTH domain antitoxin